MKTIGLTIILIFFAVKASYCITEGKSPVPSLPGMSPQNNTGQIDSMKVYSFFQSYPELAKYKTNILTIYRNYKFSRIWFDSGGVTEFGNNLYSKFKDLPGEGVSASFPYQEKIAGVFEPEIDNTLSDSDTEIMLSCLFIFYTDKVFRGLDDKTTTSIGWFIPHKQLSYHNLLDSLMTDPRLLDKTGKISLPQYTKLKTVLTTYKEIEKNGGWNHIDVDPKFKAFKPGDTAKAIVQIRARLFATGELKANNGSNKYDSELSVAVKKYQLHNGKIPVSRITADHIKEMNVPVTARIRQIVLNMERCRWISPDVILAREYVFVNIPSYWLTFIRDNKVDMKSPVVVGKKMNKTVIFSGDMSYIVFSPYWNVPASILNKEVKPGIAKDPNYLESHNMEWNNGMVRQKPGKTNSLGLVKFIFPNSNDIYLHDTPSKSLFERESRAFSHGCIRVGKPRDLAIAILKNDPNWTPAKIDAAMNAGKESTCVLKEKIPVYIGYFTAWVDELGEMNFYEDVYSRDERLAGLMMQ